MRVLVLLMLLSLLSCVDGDASTPAPPPALEAWCRCSPYGYYLALVRVETVPAPFRMTQEGFVITGMEFNVVVERGLASSFRPESTPPMRFRARQSLAQGDGSPLYPSTTWDAPQYVSVHQGDLLLVDVRGSIPVDRDAWAIFPRAANATTGALTRPLFSFPVGTPASQVLDPAEWTCNAATPTRGDCTPFDAGSL
jgi:hypothetical protein